MTEQQGRVCENELALTQVPARKDSNGELCEGTRRMPGAAERDPDRRFQIRGSQITRPPKQIPPPPQPQHYT